MSARHIAKTGRLARRPADPCYAVTAKELTFQPAAIIACWRSARYRRVTSVPPERGQVASGKVQSQDIEQRVALGCLQTAIRGSTGIVGVQGPNQLAVFLDNEP